MAGDRQGSIYIYMSLRGGASPFEVCTRIRKFTSRNAMKGGLPAPGPPAGRIQTLQLSMITCIRWIWWKMRSPYLRHRNNH